MGLAQRDNSIRAPTLLTTFALHPTVASNGARRAHCALWLVPPVRSARPRDLLTAGSFHSPALGDHPRGFFDREASLAYGHPSSARASAIANSRRGRSRRALALG